MTQSVQYETYQWLCEHRPEVSSWAVWENPPAVLDPVVGLSTSGVGEVDFFKVDDAEEYKAGVGRALRRDVVLIGLNPAGRLDADGNAKRDDRLFGCFHDNHPKQVKDHRLRAVAYHWDLWGGFIVDLDPITVETSSSVALAKLLADPGHRAECAALLAEALDQLKPSKDARLVLLGGQVERCSRLPEFREVFQPRFATQSKTIWHYAHRGSLERRVCNATKVLGARTEVSHLWVPGRTVSA